MTGPARAPFSRARRRQRRQLLALAAALAAVGAASAIAASAAAVAPTAFRSGVPPHPALVGCLNADDDEPGNPRLQGTVYADFVEGRPARLRYWSGRWSSSGNGGGGEGGKNNRSSTKHHHQRTVTLASSLTAGRLDQLEAQCRLWSGPVSAVVFLAVRGGKNERLSNLSPSARAELDAAARSVAALHARSERDPSGCALDVLLLFETAADDRVLPVLPVNAMRNYALLQARTPVVVLADVDLLPSVSLSRWLLSPSPSSSSSSSATTTTKTTRADELRLALEAEDALYVLPAFETPRLEDAAAARALAERAARAAKKTELEAMASRGEVLQFALRLFHEGHDDTDYSRWWRAPEDDGLPLLSPGGGAYVVPGKSRTFKDYEPWFLVGRARAPWANGKFRGYGWNKVTMLAHLKALAFEFRVHPAGFLVHRQHERSAADRDYQSHKRAYEAAAAKKSKAKGGGAGGAESPAEQAVFETIAGVTHRLRDEVVAALEEERGGGRPYVPALDAGVRGCVAALPWWRELGGGRAVEEAVRRQKQDEVEEDGRERQQQQPKGAEGDGACVGDGGACIGAGDAGERAALAQVLAELGGALPSPGVGKNKKRSRWRR